MLTRVGDDLGIKFVFVIRDRAGIQRARHQLCNGAGGTTAGELPIGLCGRSLIDARVQTETAPNEKMEMPPRGLYERRI